jgi:PilZ domain
MAANLSELLTNHNGVDDGPEFSAVSGSDRRKRARTRLHWPICLFRHESADAFQTVTRDLSSSGLSFLAAGQFTPGELLACALKIPTHDPNGKHVDLSLQCKVRVVRVDASDAKGVFGVASRIEDYQFARATDTRAS